MIMFVKAYMILFRIFDRFLTKRLLKKFCAEARQIKKIYVANFCIMV